MRVLLVDDDTSLCASLQRLLRLDGFDIAAVHTASDGARRAAEESFALIVLDVMLPGDDGRTVLKKIRTTSNVPVIMLTARGDEADRIAGLEAGADDYLPNPFNPRELVARMRAVLKRRMPQPPRPQIISIGDLEIHLLVRRVLQQNADVTLTGAEFDILPMLVKSAGKVVSRDEIAEICLGGPVALFDRSVDNHIRNLRKKTRRCLQRCRAYPQSAWRRLYLYRAAGAAMKILRSLYAKFVIEVRHLRGFLERGAFAKPLLEQLIMVLIIAGLFCLLLTRHIVAPVRALQVAVLRLAAGDLDTRVLSAIAPREDELTDTARAFDQMADRIQVLIQKRQEILADISHELRSPLTRLSVSLELLRRGESDVLDKMQSDLDQMNCMIGKILHLTRIDLQPAQASFAHVDLVPLLESIATNS